MATARPEARQIGPLTRFETLRQDTQLGHDLPHLSNVFAVSPNTKSRISTFDFDRDWQISSQQHFSLDYLRGEPTLNVAEILSTSDQTPVRAIIIEDISSSLVRQLIDLLDISPEVFEEHLLNCGWEKDGNHPCPEASLWNSKRVSKSHISVEWSRAYLANCSGKYLSIGDRALAVQDINDPDQEEAEEPPETYERSWEYHSNTWRKHLNFGMRSWTGNMRESVDIVNGTSLAGDERVTFWYGIRGAGLLLIVLTDCGFVSDSSTTSTGSEAEPVRYYQVRDSRRSHDGLPRRNLFRNRDPLWDARDSGYANDLTTGEPSTFWQFDGHVSRPVSSRSPSHNQEPVDTLPIEMVQQPNPNSIPEGNKNNSSTTFETARLFPGDDNGDTISTNNPSPSAALDVPPTPIDSSPVSGIEQLFTSLVTDRPTVLKNVASRCPIEYTNLDQARATRTFFAPLTSTREDFCQWIYATPQGSAPTGTRFGPLSLMFMIFHHDTIDFLQLVEKYLDDIIDSSSDEVEIEKNITMWRKMLCHLDQRLRRLLRTALEFANFLSQTPQNSRRGAPGLSGLAITSKDIINRVQETQRYIQKTNTSIASSISVAESRRGISEAESVTRLTELAFIFVPLSFAASFFGMQVKELNPETTSIFGFVGLAIGVVVVAYAVRLLIRSQFLIYIRRSATTSIRTHAGLSEGRPIRTRDFLNWVWHRTISDYLHFVFGRDYYDSLITFAVVLSAMVVMISVWASSSLVSDMKLAISLAAIVIFILLLSLACVFNMRALRKLATALRRHRQRQRRRRAQRNQDMRP